MCGIALCQLVAGGEDHDFRLPDGFHLADVRTRQLEAFARPGFGQTNGVSIYRQYVLTRGIAGGSYRLSQIPACSVLYSQGIQWENSFRFEKLGDDFVII